MKTKNEMWLRLEKEVVAQKKTKRDEKLSTKLAIIWILSIAIIAKFIEEKFFLFGFCISMVGVAIIFVYLSSKKIQANNEEVIILAEKRLDEATVKSLTLEKEIPELKEILSKNKKNNEVGNGK